MELKTVQRSDSQAARTEQLPLLPLLFLNSAPAKLAQGALSVNLE